MCGSFFFALVLFVSCVQDRAVTVDSLVLHSFFAFNVKGKLEHERRNENFKSAAYRNPQRGKELPPLMESKWGPPYNGPCVLPLFLLACPPQPSKTLYLSSNVIHLTLYLGLTDSNHGDRLHPVLVWSCVLPMFVTCLFVLVSSNSHLSFAKHKPKQSI